jgi:1-acyl-sn-glycerol-3-phosphate acyltransferase
MFYHISRGMLRLFFRLFGGISASGTEDFPKSGGVILAPNHISYLDPPAVGCGLRRPVRFMAKEELFKPPLLGPWIRRVGSFPVRRGHADRKAIRQAIELLGSGEVVCIFPEGTRSTDGRLQEAELGIGLIALKSQAPVVPVAIAGTDKILPTHGKRLHRHRVSIAYGKPIAFPDLYESGASREAMEEIGRRVMAAIAELRSAGGIFQAFR